MLQLFYLNKIIMNEERKRKVAEPEVEPVAGPSKKGKLLTLRLRQPVISCAVTTLGQQQKLPFQNLQRHSGEEDGKKFRSLFPEELWLQITNKLKDPLTLRNSSSASPFLEKRLETRRVEYLFPEILPLLATWIAKKESQQDEESDSSSIGSDDDASWSHQSFILTSRLVCRSWEIGVKSYLERHPNQFHLSPVPRESLDFFENFDDSDDSDSDCEDSYLLFDDHSTKPDVHLPCLKVHNGPDVDDFLEQRFLLRSPLFHKTLVIQDFHDVFESREYTRKFWIAVTALLERHGSEVWYCKIRLTKSIVNNFSYYYKVREWLELMPNLRVLEWRYPLRWNDLTDSEDEFGNQYPIYLRCKMEDVVHENPLPRLKHLQVFKVDDLPYPMFREFVKKNDHVEKLQFHRRFPPTPQYSEFFQYDYANGLRNITDLSIVIWRLEELTELEVSTVKWPLLEKLSLFWGNNGSDMEVDGYQKWAKIFNLIERKCESGQLTSLEIRLPNGNPFQEADVAASENLRLNLPTLHEIKICVVEANFSLDFLLGCSSLENIFITFEKCEGSGVVPDVTKRIIQIGKQFGYKRMLSSNVWKLFSNLRKLSITRLLLMESPRTYEFERKFFEREGNGVEEYFKRL